MHILLFKDSSQIIPSKEISNISARMYFLFEISENYVLQMGKRQGTERVLKEYYYFSELFTFLGGILFLWTIHFAWRKILRILNAFSSYIGSGLRSECIFYSAFIFQEQWTHTCARAHTHTQTPSTLTLFIVISVSIYFYNTESHQYLNYDFHGTEKIGEINPSTNQFCNLLFKLSICYHQFIILSANHMEIKPPRMSQKLAYGLYILLQQLWGFLNISTNVHSHLQIQN